MNGKKARLARKVAYTGRRFLLNRKYYRLPSGQIVAEADRAFYQAAKTIIRKGGDIHVKKA